MWSDTRHWVTSLAKTAAQNLQESEVNEWTKTAVKTIHKEFALTFQDYGCQLRYAATNLIAAEFPSRGRQHWLAARLNRDHPGNHLIINLSGQTYDTAELQGPVLDIVMSGGCVPPLEVLLRLCVSSHRWLSRSTSCVIVAHGSCGWSDPELSQGMAPVLLFFSCYLSWAGLCKNPTDGILKVSEALEIPAEGLPSLHRYLRYFEMLIRGNIELVRYGNVRLARLVLLELTKDGLHRRLEIWQQERLLLQSPVERCAADVGTLALQVDIPVKGDLALRILRSKDKEGPWHFELKACFHSAFMELAGGFVRFDASEIEAAKEAFLAQGFAIDIFLGQTFVEDYADSSDVAATTTACLAAVTGPKQAAADVQFFNMAADDDVDYFRAEADAMSAQRHTVFAPDDIDAFFNDL